MVLKRRSSRCLQPPPVTVTDKIPGIGVTHFTWKSGRSFLRLSKSKQESPDYYEIRSYRQQTGLPFQGAVLEATSSKKPSFLTPRVNSQSSVLGSIMGIITSL